MKLFYFTATGNSLEVANKLGGKKHSIPQVLNSGKTHFKDDVIGIVFPNYKCDIPGPVKDFIKKVTLDAKYTFGIITYGAFNADTNKVLYDFGKSNGLNFDYINNIIMVDNSFVYYDMEKQIEGLPKKKVDENIRKIKRDITDRKKSLNRSIPARLSSPLVSIMHSVQKEEIFHENFYLEKEKCVKCGICKKVCPINNIDMIDGFPKLQNRCIRCGACTHNCPKNAIRYKNEKSASRFRNATVSLKDIIDSNNIEKTKNNSMGEI